MEEDFIDYSSLSVEKLHERVTKLMKMRSFYQYKEHASMLENIDLMIDQCYSVLNEKAEKQYFEETIGMNTGEVMDAATHKMNTGTTEKKIGRKGRSGSII